MIYELDKRQLLRLWSVLSSFGEIRETKDPIIQSEILRRAQLVFDRLRLRPETSARGSNQYYPTRRRSQPNGDVRRLVGTGDPDNGAFVAHSNPSFAEQPVSAFGRQAARHYVIQLTLVSLRLD